MKAVIMADGKAKRWTADYPKHFIEINGERIIERTIKLLKEYTDDIYITTHNPDMLYLKDKYNITIYEPKDNTHEITKFINSKPLWKDDNEILFIYGDVYFTKQAIDKIFNTKPDEYYFYGGAWEIYALRVNKNTYTRLECITEYIKELADKKQGGLCGAWTLYRIMQQKDMMEHKIYNNFIDIPDETFDFDTVGELIEWKNQHHKN